jgi:hypothetical protein
MVTVKGIDQVNEARQKTCGEALGVTKRRQCIVGTEEETESVDDGDRFQRESSFFCYFNL